MGNLEGIPCTCCYVWTSLLFFARAEAIRKALRTGWNHRNEVFENLRGPFLVLLGKIDYRHVSEAGVDNSWYVQEQHRVDACGLHAISCFGWCYVLHRTRG